MHLKSLLSLQRLQKPWNGKVIIRGTEVDSAWIKLGGDDNLAAEALPTSLPDVTIKEKMRMEPTSVASEYLTILILVASLVWMRVAS